MRHQKRKRESGQGMTEYILIVALIAIGTIAIVTLFGDQIRNLFVASTKALTGEGGDTEKVDVQGAEPHKTLKDFAKDAGGGP